MSTENAVFTRITMQKDVDVNANLPVNAGQYPKFIVNLAKSIQGVSAEELGEAVTRIETAAVKAASSEKNAKASADAAKVSQDAASASQKAAKESETLVTNNTQASTEAAAEAKASAMAAKTSETNSKTSESAAKTSETNAKVSETNAKSSETEASESAASAKTSATAAKDSETKAKTSQDAAKQSETTASSASAAATQSASDALASATAAEESKQLASISANSAGSDSQEAKASALAAKESANSSSSSASTSETAALNALQSSEAAFQSAESAKSSKDAAAQSATISTTAAESASSSSISAKSEADRAKTIVDGIQPVLDGKLDKNGGGTVVGNSNILSLKNSSENQALYIHFLNSKGVVRGFVGAGSDKSTMSIVNGIAGTELRLTDDKRITFQGRDLAALNRVTGEARAASNWFAGQSGASATFIKLCTIGTGTGDSQSQRFQIFVTNTSPTGFSSHSISSEAEQHFGIINIAIGNGGEPNKNILGSYFCTGHFDLSSSTIVPVLIRQINPYKAEIWLRANSFTSYTCLANTQGDIEISQHVTDQWVAPEDKGEQSAYYISNVRVFATANKYGNVEARDTMKVTASGNYPRVTLTRADDTYVSLEADIPSNGNMANLIHRNQSNANIAVIAFPNRTGTALLAGDFGFGGKGEEGGWDDTAIGNLFKGQKSQIWRTNSTNTNVFRYSTNLYMAAGDTFSNICVDYANTNVKVISGVANNPSTYKANTLWGTSNTTVDSNGNLKKASPVVQLFADKVILNDESEGIEMERLDKGVYLIKNILGLNSDPSWGGIHGGIVIPKGINDLNLVWLEYEVLADGNMIIKTFYRKHPDLPKQVIATRLKTYPEFTDEHGNELESYAPCDIPNGHWVDLRVQMPSNSIYNQNMEAMKKDMEERKAREDREEALQNIVNTQDYWLGNETLEVR